VDVDDLTRLVLSYGLTGVVYVCRDGVRCDIVANFTKYNSEPLRLMLLRCSSFKICVSKSLYPSSPSVAILFELQRFYINSANFFNSGNCHSRCCRQSIKMTTRMATFSEVIAGVFIPAPSSKRSALVPVNSGITIDCNE